MEGKYFQEDVDCGENIVPYTLSLSVVLCNWNCNEIRIIHVSCYSKNFMRIVNPVDLQQPRLFLAPNRVM